MSRSESTDVQAMKSNEQCQDYQKKASDRVFIVDSKAETHDTYMIHDVAGKCRNGTAAAQIKLQDTRAVSGGSQ